MLKRQGIEHNRRKSESPTKTPLKIQTGFANMETLIHAIHTTPIIDNHAHPLLTCDAQCKYPLLSITTEAHDDAMKATTSTLSHLRAVKQLSGVLGCKENWEDVVTAIRVEKAQKNDAWNKRCLEGIETILIDDGLDGKNDVYDYAWHNRLTRSKCKRIVRIEQVAEGIMRRLRGGPTVLVEKLFPQFMESFLSAIKQAIYDVEVVGFKSVICYRTGLNIPALVDSQEAAKAYRAQFLRLLTAAPEELKGLVRIDGTILNAFLVHETAKLIRDSTSKHKKPFQFHTGLGDNDITLDTSSPSHLQEFIRTYPKVPIVLLHASYPWTKEAGYLASVYENVYADIGEVFPMVSKEGQENVIREILELCPTEKILWSTDGHWFPETYLLAVIQVREALETVLSDYVHSGALSVAQAISAVQDMLFKTSNNLYDLRIPLVNLPYTRKRATSLLKSPTKAATPSSKSPPKVTTISRTPSRISTPASLSPSKPLSFSPISPSEESSDLTTFTTFLLDHPGIKYLRLQYLDYTSTLRLRVIPTKRVLHIVETKNKLCISIANAALSILQNDTCPDDVKASAVGEYQLRADFSSLKSGPSEGYASVQSEFKDQSFKDVDLCPRTLCRQAIEQAKLHELEFLLGFEIEIVFLAFNESVGMHIVPPEFGRGLSWGSSCGISYPLPLQLLNDIYDALTAAGIHLEYFHSESADGQYEFVLPPLPPLEAVDTLIHARQIIVTVAQGRGLRATLHPKPFSMQAGTASHVHISLVSPEYLKDGQLQVQRYESFYAGILRHLSSILAFTYPQQASYDRMADSCWAGGTWASWGTQNREAALRKVEGSHWEIKVLDGLANPYFAIAAIISAGTLGVVDKEKLALGDCQHDPGMLSVEKRTELGITRRLPKDLIESLDALEKDEELKGALGEEFVERYLSVKRAETKNLNGMSAEERREWIIERY